jgi:hypothetical protein
VPGAGTRAAAAGGARPVFDARDLAARQYACVVMFLWAIVQRIYAAGKSFIFSHLMLLRNS